MKPFLLSGPNYGNVLIEGTWETLIMVALSTALAYVIGVPLGVALIVTQPQGIRPHKGLYGVLGWIVNIGRSLPFAILLVAIMPYHPLPGGHGHRCPGRHPAPGDLRGSLRGPHGGDFSQ